MQHYLVGQPYPHPLPRDLRALLQVDHGSLAIILQLAIEDPTPLEVATLRSAALRLAVFASAPLAWFVLAAPGLAYDAPYAVGLEDDDDASAIRTALRSWTGPGERRRQIIHLHCADAKTTKVFALRAVSVSGAWMNALATAILAGPPRFSPGDLAEAQAREYRAKPRVAMMLDAASIVEVAGRV